MAIALLVSATVTGATGGTTGAIDTSGASLLVAQVTDASGAGAVSDSKGGNTWVPLTTAGVSTPDETLYYVENPTVGSGHTFTIAGVFNEFTVAAFSGAKTTGVFDQENGLSGGGFDGTNGKPGSITPSEDNELIVLGVAFQDNTNRTVDSGMTIISQTPLTGGVNYGGLMAYKVQTTAAAINPLCNFATPGGISIASFKAAAAGGSAADHQLIDAGLVSRGLINAGEIGA